MRSGTTSTGFNYEFDEQRLDDMRFVDVLAEVMDPNGPKFEKVSGISKLIRMLLGEEMKEKLYDHISNYTGKYRVDNAVASVQAKMFPSAMKSPLLSI